MFRRPSKNSCISIALLLLIFLPSSVYAQKRGTFVGAVNYPAGAPVAASNTGYLFGGVTPLDAKLGDVNGDGKVDVIIAAGCSTFFSAQCPNGYAVVVYLSNGDGTFQPPILSGVTLPSGVRSIAVGDFNNDGRLDVAVASDCSLGPTSGGCISILLGAGDGTFTQASQYTFDGIVSQAKTLAVGDFNHDGNLDLIVGQACFNLSTTGCATGAISIYLGNGDGTLGAPAIYNAVGNNAIYPVVADFNGDGKLDVIAGIPGYPSSLSILLGNGNGTFSQSTVTLSFGALTALAPADFNGDGKVDLAIVASNGAGLEVLFGNGDGTFQAPVATSTGLAFPVTNGNTIIPTDLNGDGKPDLLVSGGFGSSQINGVQVFLNDGTGNFTVGSSYPLGGWEVAPIVAADFNGDGKTDVVMASGCSESVTPGNHCPDGSIGMLLGNGDGTFQGPRMLSNPGGGVGIYSSGSADFNGDGIPDLFSSSVCTQAPACGVGILLSNASGTYQPQTIVLSGAQEPLYSVAGDFNGDGKQDLAILNTCDSQTTCNSPSVTILLGNGDGTFQAPVTYPVGGSTATGIVLGDFNGDGKLDVGTASQCSNSSTCSQGMVNALLGNGDGTFQPVVSTPVGSNAIGLIAAGDFNSDGKTDLVVGTSDSVSRAGLVAVLLSNGDGTFSNSANYSSGGAAASFGGIAVASLRLNKMLDIVIGNECEPSASDAGCSNGSIDVLLGNGNGAFTTAQPVTVTDGNLTSARLVDVNGDGFPDLIATTTGGVIVALGKGDGTFLPPVSYAGLAEGRSEMPIVTALLNDGAPDIVQPDSGGNFAVFYNRGGTFINAGTSASPLNAGQPVTFSATVAGSIQKNMTPSGSVTFYDGTTALATVPLTAGTASLTVSNLSVGSHSITAFYSGDTNFNPHGAARFTQVVVNVAVPTTTTLASSLNPALAGQSITFTVTVSGGTSPTGSVTFNDGTSALATVPLIGTQASYTTSSLAVGAHALSASYGGDSANAGSTSSTFYESIVAVQSGAALYGVVTDRSSGRPLVGVAVKLCNTQCGQALPQLLTTTDAGGNYSLTGSQLGIANGTLVFQLQGYWSNPQTFNITTAPTQLNASLLPGGMVIQGTVTDAATQQGISGATVTFMTFSRNLIVEDAGPFIISTQTGAGGSYGMDSSHFMEGTTSGISFQNQTGYADVSDTGYLSLTPASFNVTAPLPATENYSLIPSNATVLQGTITDRGTGLPLVGVAVKLCSTQCGSSLPQLLTITDSNGNYKLTGSEIGASSGMLVFQFSGYWANPQSFAISAIPTQLNASLLAGGPVIQGTVTDAATQQGISGATVTFMTSSRNLIVEDAGPFIISTQTGAGGSYTMDSSHFMEGATSGISFQNQAGYANISGTGYLSLTPASFNVTVPLPVRENYALIPAGATVLQGTITNRTTGLPLAGVAVKLCSTQCGNSLPQLLTMTDANGNYSLSGSQLGGSTGTLVFQLAGYWANPQTITISVVPTQLNASLLPGGAVIQGTITDAVTQQGIAGATVTFMTFSRNLIVEDAGPFIISIQSSTGGSYSMDSSHFMESASTGLSFQNQANYSLISAPGYLSITPAGFNVAPPYPVVENYSLTPSGPENTIVVSTSPSGLALSVDGASFTSSQSFQWPTGSVHTLAASSPQGSGGTQNVFAQWSDTGPQTHQVTISGAATYTATFTTQYLLTTSASPAAGGTITTGGWFNAGSSVTITATPNSGYVFTGFSGGLSGTTTPQTVVMNAPVSVTASFALIVPTSTVLTSSANPAIFGQGVTFTATVSGGNAPTGSVTFKDGSSILATTTLSGNQAAYTTSSLAGGSHPIAASYSGDSANASSTSSTLYESVLNPQLNAALIGVVTDRNTGVPLPGVNVIYGCRSCSTQTVTDANGQYSLTATQISNNSNSVLIFQGHGYFATQVSYTITSSPTTVNATLLPGGTLVQGMVTDANTHLPIAGASVGISNNTQTLNGLSTTADSNGNFAFDSSLVMDSVASGFPSQGLSVTSPGYFTYIGSSFQVAPPYPVIMNVAMIPAVGTVLQGTVTDRNTGVPLPGVNVIFGCRSCSPQTVTDANGQYSLTAAQISNNSNSVLIFQGHGYFATQVSYTITSSPTTVNATLLPGGTLVQGMVTDANTHLPIAGASVGIGNSTQTLNGLSTTADSSGNFAFDSSLVMDTVASGFNASGLFVTSPGYFSYIGSSFQVAPPYPVVMNAPMIPAVGTVLQGTVTDRNTSAPLPGVKVIYGCRSCATQTVTDANGQYSLTAAQISNNSNSVLIFQGHGYFATQVSYTITSSPTTVNATLLPGGTLVQGMVTDANTHLPIAGASVGIGNSTQTLNGLSTTADNSGSFAFDSSLVMDSVASGFGASGLFVTSSPGYFVYSGAPFVVQPPYPVIQNAQLAPTGITVSVNVTASPANLQVTVDGTAATAPATFTWVPGNPHTIATSSPQAGSTGTQYAFAGWSNGGAISQTIVTPTSSTTYTASFNTQYLLTTSVSPAAGGTITAGSWFNAGASVSIQATANGGYQFTGFSGALSGTTNPQTLAMTGPMSVTATFAPIAAPTTTALVSSVNPDIFGQSMTFTATVSGSNSPTGTVTFKDGSTVVATVALSGNQAVFNTSSLAVGSHPITATYNGDASNKNSMSAILYQSVMTLQTGAVLYGTVTDRSTSLPIAGVSITNCTQCSKGAGTLTITDASGNYSLTAAQLGNTVSGLLNFQVPGYFVNVAKYSSGTTPTILDVTLLPGGTLVQGTVTDATTSTGIVGASLTTATTQGGLVFPNGSSISLTTGSGGQYTIDSSNFYEPAVKGFTLSSVGLSAAGYFSNSAGGFSVSAPFPVTQNFTMLADSGVVLQGTVTDRSTGLPIAGVGVTNCGMCGKGAAPTTTDANGNYTLTGALLGNSASGTLYFQAPGYYVHTASYSITAVPTTLNATLLPGGTVLQGTVTDASTQAGIVGASLTMQIQVTQGQGPAFPGGSSLVATTGSGGQYAIDSSNFYELAATGFTVSSVGLSATGYFNTAASSFSVSTALPVTQNFTMLPDSGVVLQGNVKDRSTGLPIVGVAVTNCGMCTKGAALTTTDANGNYSLTGAELNNSVSGTLYFQAGAYYVNTASYSITAIPTTLNVTLLPGGTVLQGTVTDANTQAGIVGASVLIQPQTTQGQQALAFPNGVVSVATGSGGQYTADSSNFFEAAAAGFTVSQVKLFAAGYVSTFLGPFAVATPFPVTQNFTMSSTGALVSVTVATIPAGLGVSVDGTSYTAPQTFQWQPSNEHTIAATTPQPMSAGAQYAFSTWSIGGPVSQTVVAPGKSTTYTASFNTQYLLTTFASPAAGGTVTASGWFDAGSSVTITAAPNSGYNFTGFSGDLTGATNPQTLAMNAPLNVTASFAPSIVSTNTSITAPAVSYGTAASVIVSVTAAQGTAAGNVSLAVDSGAPLTQSLSSGSTVFSISGLSTGTHNLSASYAAQNNFAASSATGTLQVNQATTSVSVNNIPGSAVFGASFTPAYAYTGDGTTSTTSNTTTTCTVSGGTVNFVGVGTCSLLAHAAAGTNYAAATGTPQSFNIAQATSTVSINNIPSNAVFGGSFIPTFTYTGDGTTSAISSTTAACTISGGTVNFVGAGTCTLVAHATAGTNYAAATGTPQSFNIAQATPTVSINNIPPNAVFGGSFTPTFAYNGDGTPSATSSTTTCTVSGGIVRFVAAGTCTLTARSTAGTNYSAATGAPQSFAIAQATTTISISNIPTTAVYGSGFIPTYSYIGDGVASTTSSTPSTCVVSGSSVSFVGTGTCMLTSRATAGTNYAATTGSIQSFAITKATTATRVVSSQNPQIVNQPVTFTANVTGQFGAATTGSVAFKNGTTILGTVALSGNQASLTISFATAGTRSVTAQYSGDANNLGSTSAPLSQSVVTKFATTTALTSSLNPSFTGQTVTLTTTVSSAGGAPPNGELITFKHGTTTLGTAPLSGGSASFTISTLSVGTNTITASYVGDASFATSTSAGLNQVVKKYQTTTSLSSSLNPSTFGQSVTLTATVTSSGPSTPTGNVVFKNGASTLATVTMTNGVATLTRSNLPAGTLTLTAAYNGDASSATSVSPTLSQVVNQAITTTTVASSKNPSTAGLAVKFTATVTSPTTTPSGTVTFTSGSVLLGTVTLAGGKASVTTSTLPVGNNTVTATYNGTANLKGSSGSLNQQVN